MARKEGFTFEVKEVLGVIAERSSGWKLELTNTSWNGGEAKYDIRPWNADHTDCGKGLTLTSEELAKLGSLLETHSFI
jgi:hypothetical protein